jgi:hypothetical protein
MDSLIIKFKIYIHFIDDNLDYGFYILNINSLNIIIWFVIIL